MKGKISKLNIFFDTRRRSNFNCHTRLVWSTDIHGHYSGCDHCKKQKMNQAAQEFHRLDQNPGFY
jgi:hypothetical protein